MLLDQWLNAYYFVFPITCFTHLKLATANRIMFSPNLLQWYMHFVIKYLQIYCHEIDNSKFSSLTTAMWI